MPTLLDSARVRDLVAATPLADAEIIGGRDGLDRPVADVMIVEAVNATVGVRRDTLLIAGSAGPLAAGAGADAIARLAAAGVAAVAVRRGYYLGGMSDAVRRAADEHAIAVFALPRGVRAQDVAEAVESVLIDRRYHALQRADEVQRSLAELLMGGGDLSATIRRASELLGNPLVLEDAAGRLLASAGISRAPRLHGLTLRSTTASAEADGMPLLATPILGAQGRAGTLALVGRRPFGAYDETALDQVASVIALELVRGDQLRAAEARLVADLVRDAVAARGASRELLGRARALGLDLERPHVVVAAGIEDLDDALAARGRVSAEDREAVVAQVLEAVSAELGSRAAIGRDGDGALALVPAALEATLEARLARAGERIDEREHGLQLAAGWGRAAELGGLRRSAEEARRARAIGRALRAGRAQSYREVEVYDALLRSVTAGGPGADAATTVTGLGHELRQTLELYLSCGLSIARTAERLYVHKNTVRYRLKRIEETTGRSLGTLEDRLMLEIGVVAAKLGE